MVMWPIGFCKKLVEKGYRVIRFDNRDIGLSCRVQINAPRASRVRLLLRSQLLGWATPVPYTLRDMAVDVIGLMNFLGIDRANIAGVSMGGIIAQIAAAEYPERVSSLGIIMSTTSQPLLPTPTLAAFTALMNLFKWPIRNGSAREYFGDTLRFFKSIRGADYRVSDSELEDALRRMFARSANDPDAIHPQFAAAFGAGDIRAYSRAITAKTVAIHGASDPLMRPADGKAVAKCIKGSRLELIPGMGHYLHPELRDRVAGSLHENADSSRRGEIKNER